MIVTRGLGRVGVLPTWGLGHLGGAVPPTPEIPKGGDSGFEIDPMVLEILDYEDILFAIQVYLMNRFRR